MALRGHNQLIYWTLGDMEFPNLFQGLITWLLPTKFPAGTCHRIMLMENQYWFRWWLGAIRQADWSNINPSYVCLVSYIYIYIYIYICVYIYIYKYNMSYEIYTWFHCALFCCGYIINDWLMCLAGLPILFRILALAIHSCHRATKVTMSNMGKIWKHQTIMKYRKCKVWVLCCEWVHILLKWT